jgi:glutamate synthase (NADPH/NADH) large chain
MHFALLFAYGVSAVNPYGVFATIDSLKKKGLVPADLSYQNMEENFIKAIDKGLLKVLSKMGTSTLRSYRGAQIVEAVGLSRELIDLYFTGTSSKIDGVGLKELCREALIQHEKAYVEKKTCPPLNPRGLQYRKKRRDASWNLKPFISYRGAPHQGLQ